MKSKRSLKFSIEQVVYFDDPRRKPSRKQIPNTTASATTIVEPVGVPNRIETMIPPSEQITEITAEQTVTALKLLKRRIAESAGKTINAEMSSDPTRFIATTMMIAVMIAIRRLYALAWRPDAFAKSSSKVRVVRDGIIIADDEIASLQRFKDSVKEVSEGYECGICLEKFSDLKEGDVFEVYEIEEYRE